MQIHLQLHHDATRANLDPMRTTIDLPAPVLARAKRLAAERETTLSAVVTEALSLHLQGRRRSGDEPFELVVCGTPGDPFPTAAEIDAIEGEEEKLALRIPGVEPNATS
jgi:hypothetical protein